MKTEQGYLCLTCKERHELEEFVVEQKGNLIYRSGRCVKTARDGGGVWFPANPDDVDRVLEKTRGIQHRRNLPLCFRCRTRKPLAAFRRGVQDGVPVRSAACKRHRPAVSDVWVPIKEDEA